MMKIANTPEIKKYIQELQDKNDLNMSLSDMFLDVINNPEVSNEKELNPVYKQNPSVFNFRYVSIIRDYWGLELSTLEDEEIYSKYIEPCIKELDIGYFLNNPYYKNIHINNQIEGKYVITYDNYKKYELFASDDLKIDSDYIEMSALGYFTKEFPFIVINEGDVTWMSITPNEINTMQKHIDKATGRVLVFGLGLGYFPYMISLKKDVSEIVIIEKNKEIISLFKKHILPQFEHKEKITILNKDAYEFKAQDINQKYDYVFVDLWHTPVDAAKFFINFKRIEKHTPNTAFGYWLDDGIEAFLRRCMVSLVIEQFEGAPASNYQVSESDFDAVINLFFQKTKDVVISNKKELENLISRPYLFDIISR